MIKSMKTTKDLLNALILSGETQESIAHSLRRLNVSQSRISRILNGVTTRVDVELHMAVLSLYDRTMKKKRRK
jgi:hypothetical protein